MVVIRLARGGSNKNPFYHIVAADQRFPRDGRYIERLGRFNPVARGQESRLNVLSERIEHWIKQGARPTERVGHLLTEIAKGETKVRPTRAEVKKAQQENAEKAQAAARKKAQAEAKVAEAEAAKAKAEEEKAAAADKATTTEQSSTEEQPAAENTAEANKTDGDKTE